MTGIECHSCTLIMQEDFDKAAEDAKTQVPPKAANADKLALYGLFKQATTGDVDTGTIDDKSNSLARERSSTCID